MRELGDGARLAAEALQLIGVRRDLAVHQLDRDLPLERLVERAVDRRHAAGADLGIEPVAAAQLHPYERAHVFRAIVADLRRVDATVVTKSISPMRRPTPARSSGCAGPPGPAELSVRG
jgi:hypothetical protein